MNEWLSPAAIVSYFGAAVSVSGGIYLWVSHARKVAQEKAALIAEQKAKAEKAAEEEKAKDLAAQAQINEMNLSREEMVDRIGNKLFIDLNNERERLSREVAKLHILVNELTTQVQNLHISERNHRHNEREMISHIELLERTGVFPTPPGVPTRPKWNLHGLGEPPVASAG